MKQQHGTNYNQEKDLAMAEMMELVINTLRQYLLMGKRFE
jgi:hypothetical protein